MLDTRPPSSPGLPAPPVAPATIHLDLSRDGDRERLRAATQGRWGITPHTKRNYLLALNMALGWAIQRRDSGKVQGIVRTLANLVGQDQADEHLAIRMAIPNRHAHTHEHMTATLDGFAVRVAEICMDLLPEDKLTLFHERVEAEVQRVKRG